MLFRDFREDVSLGKGIYFQLPETPKRFLSGKREQV